MKITVLTYLESERAKSHDVVVDQVVEALGQRGHAASVLGIHNDLSKLIEGLAQQQPELVFNLAEMFGDDVRGDVDVAGCLNLLGVCYTGGGPAELLLCQDKALAKKVLAFEKILSPDFAVFSQDAEIETAGNLRMPLFVKPMCTDASIGIDGVKALVNSATDMMKRVVEIHEKVKDAALVEEYIEGREFYVGVLGNQQPLALPPIEMDFSGLQEGEPRFLDAKAKWDKRSKRFKGTKAIVADIPPETRAKLHKVSLEAYRALRVRDYGRIDLRLTETGDIYVIEANASCYLEKSAEFAMAAEAAGIEFADLVDRIVRLAVGRQHIANGRPANGGKKSNKAEAKPNE